MLIAYSSFQSNGDEIVKEIPNRIMVCESDSDIEREDGKRYWNENKVQTCTSPRSSNDQDVLGMDTNFYKDIISFAEGELPKLVVCETKRVCELNKVNVGSVATNSEDVHIFEERDRKNFIITSDGDVDGVKIVPGNMLPVGELPVETTISEFSSFHGDEIEQGSVLIHYDAPVSGHVSVEESQSTVSTIDEEASGSSGQDPKICDEDEVATSTLQLENVRSCDDDDDDARHGGGEASRMTRLEPISFSGSLSHRSDSTAASSRSFAFPILQQEWIYSPVRMRKAKHRRSPRHWSWRKSLLCCRF